MLAVGMAAAMEELAIRLGSGVELGAPAENADATATTSSTSVIAAPMAMRRRLRLLIPADPSFL
jgi:hypothetical protein